ncbi:NIL domain-containing protein [Nostoc sp. NMS8]|uniref:NIL domain-containing protein n=1 Tax=Nostoc sp. NMS8 TaxID=2815392 RepID=UPI0025DA4476|nr:NIL domain-containing protein [Nostoc sp. NMS8]MBN3957313.1 NIL domain-containing protein [Nostoc sp. NMS8]
MRIYHNFNSATYHQSQKLSFTGIFPHRNGYKPKLGAVIATIAFAGEQASKPIFATLARNFDGDVNILSGSVETVGDRRVGQFHVELEGQKVTQALKYLHQAEFEVQVH